MAHRVGLIQCDRLWAMGLANIKSSKFPTLSKIAYIGIPRYSDILPKLPAKFFEIFSLIKLVGRKSRVFVRLHAANSVQPRGTSFALFNNWKSAQRFGGGL
jgi:hypothetical protein